MARPWFVNFYKSLDMTNDPRYPHNLPKEFHKWLPKFTMNNVVTAEEHLDAFGVAMEDNFVDDEDLTMKLLASSFEEDAKKRFKILPDNHLQSYEAFTDLFKKRWTTKKDSGMLLMQFNQIKKKEGETVKEFDVRFDNLLD